MKCHKCVVATSKPFKQTCNIGKHKKSTMNCIRIFPLLLKKWLCGAILFTGVYILLVLTLSVALSVILNNMQDVGQRGDFA